MPTQSLQVRRRYQGRAASKGQVRGSGGLGQFRSASAQMSAMIFRVRLEDRPIGNLSNCKYFSKTPWRLDDTSRQTIDCHRPGRGRRRSCAGEFLLRSWRFGAAITQERRQNERPAAHAPTSGMLEAGTLAGGGAATERMLCGKRGKIGHLAQTAPATGRPLAVGRQHGTHHRTRAALHCSTETRPLATRSSARLRVTWVSM
jgi:hypothetical protein